MRTPVERRRRARRRVAFTLPQNRHDVSTHLPAGQRLRRLRRLSPSIQRALSIPANNATGTIRDVEDAVILMQENRAFAPCFGMLPGVRGFVERFPIPLSDGRSVWRVSDAALGQRD